MSGRKRIGAWGCLKKGAIILGIIVGAFVVFLGICVALGVIGYNNGHSLGYETGKVEGYDEGHSQGYDKGQLEGYEEGHSKGYPEGHAKAAGEGFLVNPSYQEMKDFINADKTNTKPWVEGEYDCRDMTADINKNAEAQGIRAAEVYIELPTAGSYTLVAFETTDKGLIFLEPQSDAEMKVEVGVKLWEDNGYQKPDYDDTIKEVVITW